ncbi:hypothetical protein B0T19DRAFT_24456 [Cercophora scortea]|uniref:Uncharacterized protein n=1 Tax=Cercophora scortea TaxID=314031 RepID=A0AAE0J2X2_9PEZI|nr:hypothetical protein B0T19DRAFT_24456 [Cercophora scortea]
MNRREEPRQPALLLRCGRCGIPSILDHVSSRATDGNSSPLDISKALTQRTGIRFPTRLLASFIYKLFDPTERCQLFQFHLVPVHWCICWIIGIKFTRSNLMPMPNTTTTLQVLFMASHSCQCPKKFITAVTPSHAHEMSIFILHIPHLLSNPNSRYVNVIQRPLWWQWRRRVRYKR